MLFGDISVTLVAARASLYLTISPHPFLRFAIPIFYFYTLSPTCARRMFSDAHAYHYRASAPALLRKYGFPAFPALRSRVPAFLKDVLFPVQSCKALFTRTACPRNYLHFCAYFARTFVFRQLKKFCHRCIVISCPVRCYETFRRTISLSLSRVSPRKLTKSPLYCTRVLVL